MRESVGGLVLMKIMVVFIMIYSSFLAISINYAMAFRVKDQIMSLLEQYEGCQNAQEKISAYITKVGYHNKNSDGRIYSIEPVYIQNRGTYYKVTTYISFDIPLAEGNFSLPITGETKIIYNLSDDSTQCSNLGKS